MPPAPTKPILSMGDRSPAEGDRPRIDRAIEGRGLGGHALGGEGLVRSVAAPACRRRRRVRRGAVARASARPSASPGSARKGMVGAERLDRAARCGSQRQAGRGTSPPARRAGGPRSGTAARAGRRPPSGRRRRRDGRGRRWRRSPAASASHAARSGPSPTSRSRGRRPRACSARTARTRVRWSFWGVKRPTQRRRGASSGMPERRAGLGAGADDGRRLDAVPDHDETGAGAEAGERRRPGRRRRLRDRDEGVDGCRGRGVIRLLGGLGDEPRQVLGPHNAHARSGAGGGKRLALPADAGVDVQEAGAARRRGGRPRRRRSPRRGRRAPGARHEAPPPPRGRRG